MLLDWPTMPVVVSVSSPWDSESLIVRPSYWSTEGIAKGVFGVIRPSESAPPTTTILNVEPGS